MNHYTFQIFFNLSNARIRSIINPGRKHNTFDLDKNIRERNINDKEFHRELCVNKSHGGILYLLFQNVIPDEECVFYAASVDCIEIVKLLQPIYQTPLDKIFEVVVKHDSRKVLEFIFEKDINLVCSNLSMVKYISLGDIECIKFLIEKSRFENKYTQYHLVTTGNIKTLAFYYERGRRLDKKHFDILKKNKFTDCIQYIKDNY